MKNKKIEIEQIYPLSPMQEGMLFQAVVNRESNAYFERIEIDIRGNVDVDLFRESFNLLIRRYDVLRTRFVDEKIKRWIISF